MLSFRRRKTTIVPIRQSAPVYLTRADIQEVVGRCYAIAGSSGRARTERVDAVRHPGWSVPEVAGALRRAEVIAPFPNIVDCRGVWIHPDKSVVVDDGSPEHAAAVASWTRSSSGLLIEPAAVLHKQCSSPVIVHAPHTSRYIPADVRPELELSNTDLAAELDAMTDAGVLAVLESLTDPLPTIAIATMSRLVFDPERFPVGDPMEEVGMGLVYTRRADGSPLRSPLTPESLDWYRARHRSYTASLERLVEAAIEHFEAAVIVDLHSYPKDPLGYEDATRERPEICIGTDPLHTPDWLAAAAGEAFAPRFTVGVNSPFSGAYVPGRFYGTGDPVYAVMVEVRRDVLERPGAAAEVAHQIAQIKHCADQTIRAGRCLACNEGER